MTQSIWTDQEIFESYWQSIHIPRSTSPKLVVIGMVGLVGSGKSTVAAALADRLGMYVASNDAVRRFLNGLGFEGTKPRQPLLQLIVEETQVRLLKRHVSCIIDNDLLKFWEVATENAHRNGAEFYLIEVTCPEKIILERIETRIYNIAKNDAADLSHAGVGEYYDRKQAHKETSRPESIFFTFDTSNDLAPQVEEFANKLESDNA